ncbi:MAG: NAD(P)H-dependent oxidoreductase [Clostridiales bacterium]|nr:NAD(P)H-dependent oxidoreductase [Clostridiales bacterium]
MILFINACVREASRTRRLAEAVLEKIRGEYEAEGKTFEIEECNLGNVAFPVADEAFLLKRDALEAEEKWDDPMFDLARQFAQAEEIVIAAPYWDLSFPAALKQYFEQINVMGITFRYTPEGFPEPMCSAKKLHYVTTVGGALVPEEYGFGYVKALAESFYGITEVSLTQAVGFDIVGADEEQILREAIEKL